MITVQSEELLRRLRSGRHEVADIETLEQAKATELRAELAETYPVLFLERRVRTKWEVGLAKSVSYELIRAPLRNPIVSMGLFVPVLRKCVFCSGEDDAVTGISVMSKIIVRPVEKPVRGLAQSSGRGFALDQFPDGWEVHTIGGRTVRLDEEFLLKRGWKFDVIPRLFSATGK